MDVQRYPNEQFMAVLAQLKLLVNLALIDGAVAERERIYITNIGVANGLRGEEVTKLFDQKHDVIVPKDLTDDQKFDYLFSLVQLMKIDQRLYQEEIRFCSKVASNLGYQQEVMFELMLKVKSVAMQPNEIDLLKKLTAGYLNQS